MATFEEYAKKHDSLEQEISEASEASENREQPGNSFEMPERFVGKTAEEIAQSYVSLEQQASRQGNDLGEMRRTLDEFIKLQSDAETSTEQTTEAEPLTLDDLYDDPDAAITRKLESVQSKVDEKLAALEQELANARAAERQNQMEDRFPGWQDEVQSGKFAEWVADSPYRQRLALAAQANDADAAAELVGGWYETKSTNSDAQAREQALRDGSLETPGSSSVNIEEGYSRSDLMKKRVAAKRGDPEAAAYLHAHRDAIAVAYESGHITD